MIEDGRKLVREEGGDNSVNSIQEIGRAHV